MQRQPDSVFYVADAYRQELLADAARARRKGRVDGERRPASRLVALRRSAGLILIGIGTRLVAPGGIAPEGPTPAIPA
jgi:hypothetical protein